jgi:hypothetical protein
VVFATFFVALALTTPMGEAARAADACLTQPNLESPPGSHWYYRVDRSSNRRCWYLGAQGVQVRRVIAAKPDPTTKAASRATSEARPERPIAKASAITGGKNAPGPEIFAAFWPRPQVPVDAIGLESVMSNSHADEAVTDQPEDMPLIWPVLTAAERAAFAPSSNATLMPEHLPLLFVGALAFAAVVGRVIATRTSRT